MLTYFQAILMGALQGFSELFPVSSLGHSVILPKLLGWSVNQNDNFFLIFLVATHLATALVLLGFFYKDWLLIIKGIFRSIKIREINSADIYAKLGWLIVIGTIPAGILGLLFQDKLKTLFASPNIVAVFLILNGLMLFGAELLRKKSEKNKMSEDGYVTKMTWSQSIKIGLAQCLALIPGFSRTGSTIGGGLLIGLNHKDAARFSFLLATPIIFAASLLKLPELITSGDTGATGPILVGSAVAAITAFLSVSFLTKYFETKKLIPFAVYCVAIGILSCAVFFFR